MKLISFILILGIGIILGMILKNPPVYSQSAYHPVCPTVFYNEKENKFYSFKWKITGEHTMQACLIEIEKGKKP